MSASAGEIVPRPPSGSEAVQARYGWWAAISVTCSTPCDVLALVVAAVGGVDDQRGVGPARGRRHVEAQAPGHPAQLDDRVRAAGAPPLAAGPDVERARVEVAARKGGVVALDELPDAREGGVPASEVARLTVYATTKKGDVRERP